MINNQARVVATIMLLSPALLACAGTNLYLYQNPDGRELASFKSEGHRGMVASPIPEASEAALRVLKAGGNAADAAICASFVISVLKPQSTGIGGGGFMLYYDAESRETHVLDFRERAPARATEDMYIRAGVAVQELSRAGHLAVGVPGLVAGLAKANERFGSVPLDVLIQPAIELAEKGFSVYPELERDLARRADLLASNPAMRKIFFKEGMPLKSGDLLTQKDLARTLKRIGKHGRRGFYEGKVARAIVRDMKRHGGLITRQDLSDYSVKTREAVTGDYSGYRVVSMPPPSSGGIHLIQMLNVLKGYPRKDQFEGAAATHRMIEAMRTAYSDRARLLGDPEYFPVPIAHLLSEDYAKETRKRIPASRARKSSLPKSDVKKESESTAHISVVDHHGNVVSTTQTINYSFGAGVVVPRTGIILNNEMDDFSAQPGAPNIFGLIGGEANAIAPGKTPLSSMSPTIVFKGDHPYLVLGSPGGSRIITAVLQVIINMIDYEMTLDGAVAQGRIHHQWFPDKVSVEQGLYPPDILKSLSTMGHEIENSDGSFGEVQAIQVYPHGGLVGMSDPRRSGKAMGY
jgi:gamma-glutamyltranspeptidase/glutathione hydrolase